VDGIEQAALALVRTALFASSAFLSLLVWRHGGRSH
jgi:hypothetical protein